MILKKGKSNGKTYLSIVRGYRDKATGITKTKTVQSLGYLEALEKQYDDPIAHFSNVVAEMNRKEAEDNIPVTFSIDKEKRIAPNSANRKNLGYAALSKIYHELELHRFFNNRSRSLSAAFNMNNIMKLLVFSRVLTPTSKKSTFEEKGRFFEHTDFSLDDVYRCLTFANSLKDALKLHLHRMIQRQYARKTDVVYYDVTNYYFEIDKPDALRKKGVSKEHRPNPIVQMGLFMDTSGLPISYELFPGNTNDCLTLIPFLAEIKKKYDLGRVLVVADKGLNTGMNVAFNLIKHDGYVYSQTVRGGHKELKDYVLNDDGYLKIGDDYRRKSRVYPREIVITDKNGKEKRLRIEEKQVVFYSSDYDKKAKAEREPAIAKARELVRDPGAYNRATSYGAAKYVKNLTFNKETGEIVTTKQRPVFDEEKVREEEKFDGYYAIVTSELEKTDEEIIEIYRGLWKIEESFKITKSDLSTRPVYLSRKDHIEAHFLICFVALVIVRILENRLGRRHSISKIISSLNATSCSLLEENWYICDYVDEVTEALREEMVIDLTRKYLRLGDIRKILGDTKN
jgi:transposase